MDINRVNLDYNFDSPLEAIDALVFAYNTEDLSAILKVKDFETEAKLLLEESNIKINATIIKETAEALRLSLIKNLQENGFPYFGEAKRTYGDLKQISLNVFLILETINIKGDISTNEIYLTNHGKQWRVALIKSIS